MDLSSEQRVAEPSGQRQPQGRPASADRPELDFSLIRGDLLFRGQRALGFIPRHGLGVTRRAFVFALITWLPIAIWAMLSGGTFPGMAREPLLQHFSVHVQCLVAIPLLIVGEAVAHAIVRRLIPQFVRSGLISAGDQAPFVDILRRTAHLRDAWFPWALVVGLGLGWAVGIPASWQAHEILWAGAAVAVQVPIRAIAMKLLGMLL